MIRVLNIIIYTVFVTLLVGIAGLLVGSMLPIPGNIELKIVKSGSMEPTISTGSLVIVKPSSSYSMNDVITFGADTKTEIPTTHRIIGFEADENGHTAYRTKGDANEDEDANPVARSEIIGRVVFHLPYVGFVLDFARQPLGFALLIGVPAALVILEESFTIIREVQAVLRRKRDEEDDDEAPRSGGNSGARARGRMRLVYLRRRAMDEIFVPMMIETRTWVRTHRPQKDAYGAATFVVMGIVFVSTLLSGGAGGTVAYFNDVERSLGNIFRAGVWQAPADPQNIVINEFLPNPDDSANGLNFGDDNDSKPLGEWVELYNNGNVPQDLTGWYIADESGGLGNQAAIVSALNTVPATTTISAHGWLVVYLNHQTLNNPNGDSVYLYTNLDVLVDSYTYPDHDFCENEPTPGSTNASATPSGSGSCGPGDPAAPENKSFARIPDGTGAFVDPIPTPGGPNIPDPEPMPVMVEEIPMLGAEEGEVLGAETEDALVPPVSTGGSSSSASAPPPPAPEENVENSPSELVAEETVEEPAQDQPTPPEEPLAQMAPNEPVDGSDISPADEPPTPDPAPEPASGPAPEPAPEPPPADPVVE